jgi:DNA-binding NarL/FixJ family response regulator
MTPVRVLVVDDYTLFREGLAALLNAAVETD